MKKSLPFVLLFLAALSFVLLIIKDYFPDAPYIGDISNRVFIVAFIVFGIGIAVAKEKGQPLFSSTKTLILFQLAATVLFAALVLTLGSLGGRSHAGVGLDNTIILVIVIGSIPFYLFRLKRESEES